MKAALVCLSVLLLLAASAAAQQPNTSNSSDSAVAAAERELLAADAAFNDEVQKGGVDAWTAWFAENGVEHTGTEPAVGPAAVHKFMEGQFSAPGFKLTWQPEGARSLDSGRLGMTWGRWQEHIQVAEGKSLDLTGQYITIWQKQKDGTWKVLWDGGEATKPKR